MVGPLSVYTIMALVTLSTSNSSYAGPKKKKEKRKEPSCQFPVPSPMGHNHATNHVHEFLSDQGPDVTEISLAKVLSNKACCRFSVACFDKPQRSAPVLQCI